MDLIIERFCDFKLPDEEFASLMFDRRFEKHKSSSPGVLSGTVEGRSSTVDDTEGSLKAWILTHTMFAHGKQSHAHRLLHHLEEQDLQDVGATQDLQEVDLNCRKSPHPRGRLKLLLNLARKRKTRLTKKRMTKRMMRTRMKKRRTKTKEIRHRR